MRAGTGRTRQGLWSWSWSWPGIGITALGIVITRNIVEEVRAEYITGSAIVRPDN